MVLLRSAAIVIGPTPPGTGVIAAAEKGQALRSLMHHFLRVTEQELLNTEAHSHQS